MNVFNALETLSKKRVSQLYNYRFFHEFHSCNEMSGFPGALVDELAGGPRGVVPHTNEAEVAKFYVVMRLVRFDWARLHRLE